VALDFFVSKETGRPFDHFEAAKFKVEQATRLSNGKGMISLNVMLSMHTAIESIRGAIAGGVGAIFAGAGISRNLPTLVKDTNVLLVPIVSSAEVLNCICRCWGKLGHLPDAVVLEGPLAGGHLGYETKNIENINFSLENLLPSILEVSNKYGGFPVIVAGGIWDRADIIRWIRAGAAGIQMGTRFLATKESGASEAFKQAIVAATPDDIIVATDPGSPAGMPFRIIKSSPGYQEALKRIPTDKCLLRYMIRKDSDGNSFCPAFGDPKYFCICNGLLAAAGKHPDATQKGIYTVGANAARVQEIISTDNLINELTGFTA
jgi:nitronate monooxygenase